MDRMTSSAGIDPPLSPSPSALQEISRNVRRDIIDMMWHGQGGHMGGSLSIVEVLVVLYFGTLKIDPTRPDWADRDRLILSKAHAAAALYAVLAAKGYFERARLFDSFRIRVDGMLPEHPDMRKTPGIDMSGGSLGQGLSVGVGMALGRRLAGKRFRIYVVLGDGESQEGQVWEAAMFAGHHGLDEMTAIVDCNRLQVNGPTDDEVTLEPLVAKWRAFNWHAEAVDGHDVEALQGAVRSARARRGRPSVIIARTVKGKGVSFIEGQSEWHAKAISDEERTRALRELE